MKTFVFSLLIVVHSISVAQSRSAGEVPITGGKWNEYHPSLTRSIVSDSVEWCAYERLTNDSSFIVVKRYFRITGTWDSTEVVVSCSPNDQIQRYPKMASKKNYSIVAWQKKTGAKWNICYSTYSKSSQKWSSPLQLTNDTLDNVNVRIQSVYADSQFVFAWQNKNIIRFRKYPFDPVLAKDTIAVSNYDSTEFDLGLESSGTTGAVIFTVASSNKRMKAVTHEFNLFPSLTFGALDTIQISPSIFQPRFVQYYTQNEWIVFQSSTSDIYLYNIQTAFVSHEPPIQITDAFSTRASYSNACVFHDPIVFANDESAIQTYRPYNFVLAFECRTDSLFFGVNDTALIIMQSGPTDSIISSGYNRNPAIGSNPAYFPQLNQLHVPVVWESNRSGISHLYAKNAMLDGFSDVPSSEQRPTQFSLSQNYPNPFNPRTVISYHLPAAQAGLAVNSAVTLKIFDILGREVSTLVNERQSAGTHTVDFSGDVFSSGIYFYQLRAGTFVETRKMLLLK